ncbi:hypothetical protein KM043_018231 [Ampulex compressa]|nr:hypothetical protein KM043_018231 [Ampulex compressa]
MMRRSSGGQRQEEKRERIAKDVSGAEAKELESWREEEKKSECWNEGDGGEKEAMKELWNEIGIKSKIERI